MPPSSDAATSSGAVPPGVAVSQGKPSLRRIKGRVHRSKSLDSIDLLDCNVSREITNSTEDAGRTDRIVRVKDLFFSYRYADIVQNSA